MTFVLLTVMLIVREQGAKQTNEINDSNRYLSRHLNRNPHEHTHTHTMYPPYTNTNSPILQFALHAFNFIPQRKLIETKYISFHLNVYYHFSQLQLFRIKPQPVLVSNRSSIITRNC